MKIVKLVVAVGCLLLAGCDSGDGILGGSVTLVSYSVDCVAGATCINVTDINEFSGDNSKSVTCNWHCASYKGQTKARVSISFKKDGSSCWEFDQEYINTGICN